jgi:hypothetical protein
MAGGGAKLKKEYAGEKGKLVGRQGRKATNPERMVGLPLREKSRVALWRDIAEGQLLLKGITSR